MALTYLSGGRIQGTAAEKIRPTTTPTATVTITSATGENEGFGNTITRVRQKFSTGHALIGEDITSFTVNLEKNGSPTGDVTAGIYTSGDVLKADFGLIDVSTLPTSFVTKTYYYMSGDSSIANGDSIQLRYSGGSSGNTLDWQMNNSAVSNTAGGYYVPTTWSVRTHSATMTVTHGSVVGTYIPAAPQVDPFHSSVVFC